MISAIKGKLFAITPGQIQVETPGGVIYQLFIPISLFSLLKNQTDILLYTSLKVREDQMVLYGFSNLKEKIFFEKLTSISGIGGKIALSLISAFNPLELVAAINGGDIVKISSIPGIGKKTAQRIILELTGKLEFDEETRGETVQLKEDLISGLVNLGYPAKSVAELVGKTMKEQPEITGFEELFKLLLKKISKL